jgi:hypothetical protein
MSRLELCQKLIEEARKCLENNDKQCVLRLIKDLIKNQCHNGNAVGKEIADGVRELVHELWLASSGDNEFRCGLLRMLRSLSVSKSWVKIALDMYTKMLGKWLTRCGIDWERKMMRNDVVKQLEDLLRKLGWSEVRMCEELWQFVSVDVDEFRKYGIEPCIWLEGLEKLSNLRNPYWLGMASSDLVIVKLSESIGLELNTTNTVDAVFFLKILSTVKAPNLRITWKRWAPFMKYVDKTAYLEYYITLDINNWSWLTKLDVNELKKMLNSFSDEELAKFLGGEIDGDGTIQYNKYNKGAYVEITVCKACPKRMMLDVLKEVIAERFGIVGSIKSHKTADALVFRSGKAVKLLRRIAKYVHHPLRRLRIELLLAHYEGRIDDEELEKLYEQTEYELRKPDIKRNHGLEALIRAAPQTHTHGVR